MGFAGFGKSFEKSISIISRVLNYVAMGVLVTMMLLTVADVILRYFFARPIVGSVELTEYMLVPIIFLALPWCTIKGGNPKVDIIVGRLPLRVRAALESITCLLSLGICFFICWQSFFEAGNVWERGKASDFLNVPAFPFYFVMTLGVIMLFFALLILLFKFMAKVVKP